MKDPIMNNRSTPEGLTPPTPGLDHEEPIFNEEADIPTDDSREEEGSDEVPRERKPG